MAPEPAVQRLLDEHKEYLRLDETTGRVICKLSGHSMVTSQQDILQYIGCAATALRLQLLLDQSYEHKHASWAALVKTLFT